jgi:hypothetical protein
VKKAQTTCLASFGPKVNVFFCLYYLLKNVLCFIGPTYVIRKTKQAATRRITGKRAKTGPNDMSDVSFGPYVSILFFFQLFSLLTNCII